MRTGTFWLLLAGFTTAALAIGGFVVHFVPLLTDAGVSLGRAGAMAAWVGISVVLGRLLTGYAIDRLPAAPVAAAVFVTAAAGCGLLAFGTIALAPVSALCVGFALGAEIDVASYLAARHFGARHYGKIYGILYAGVIAGITASPALYAHLFDMTGSYRAALTGSALALSLAAIVLLAAPRDAARPSAMCRGNRS